MDTRPTRSPGVTVRGELRALLLDLGGVSVILLFVLWKFAWPGILKATEERENKIKAQLAEAERLNERGQGSRWRRGRSSRPTPAPRRSSCSREAKAAVEKERAAAVDKVRAEQDALVDRTRRDIASERDKALLRAAA